MKMPERDTGRLREDLQVFPKSSQEAERGNTMKRNLITWVVIIITAIVVFILRSAGQAGE
jgi:hypothetical protein